MTLPRAWLLTFLLGVGFAILVFSRPEGPERWLARVLLVVYLCAVVAVIRATVRYKRSQGTA
jgi:hypothetical protein